MTPEKIKSIRLHIGLSRNGLAVMMQIPVSDVIDYESGQRPIPRLYQLALYAICAIQQLEESTPK